MEISFAFQLRAEHHSVGCQILDRVVTHQHMDSFFLCSTGVSVWPWCWTVAWSFTSSSIHITFSCRTWAYDDQNGVSCLVSTFLKKSYWEIFKLNWKRHAIRYFSFLAVKMTHPPLSQYFFLYSLHTGNISVYKFYSKKVIYTFCNKNYHHKYWLQNCRILVCPTVVTESFSSMETVVFMLNHWRIIWTHCNRFYRKKGCSDDDMPVMKFLKRWSCFVMNLIFFVVIRGQSTRSFMYIESKPWWKESAIASALWTWFQISFNS